MSAPTTLTDAAALRRALGHYPSGIAALAATVDGEDRVLVAASFTVGVSLEPPLVMFAVQKSSQTWPHLSRAERIGISVLAAHQGELCRQLAAKDPLVRWAGVAAHRSPTGAVHIDAAALRFECSPHSVHPAGDHDVVLLKVESLHVADGAEPLIFHRSQFRTISL